MTKARRYLFVTMEGGGNVPPVLGAARQLIDRGHAVRVLTEPCLKEAVEAIGADFIPFTEHFVRTDRQQEIFYDWEAKSPPGALARSLENVIVGPARQTAAAAARALDEFPADALVVDWLLPAAAAVGEARGLPTAILIHCINMLPAPGRPAGPFPPARGTLGRLRDRLMRYMFRRLVGRHAAAYNEMRASHGLAPMASPLEQYQRADRVLVQTSPAFDFVAEPEPDNVTYVGPILDEPDWVAGARWDSPWPADDPRPLVVVSLSSTFQNQRDALQTAMTALGQLDVRGLATLGPAMADQSFDVPDNVVAVASAPHGLVFPHAAAFITHCGHGSIMRALASGLPLVAVPMGRDQDAAAVRIVHRGLGLRPKRTPTAIAAAVNRVLTEPSFRTAAEGMATRLRQEVADDGLRVALEDLARVSRADTARSSDRAVALP
jgi:MGT family glycosyltransferase